MALTQMTIRCISTVVATMLLSNLPVAGAAQSTLPAASSEDVQLEPAIEIVKCEDERVLSDKLLSYLDSTDTGLQKGAIVATGRIGNPKAIEKLSAILSTHPTTQTRVLAAFALGEIEHQDAVAALTQEMESIEENAELRARAAEALGKIAANKQAAEALGKDGVKKIADALARLLVQTHAKNADAKEHDKDERLLTKLTLVALLRAKDPSTLASIATLLSSKDLELRFQTATVLARWKEGLEPFVTQLMKLLSDEDALVRAAAARALGAAKDQQATEKLLVLLEDNDERTVAGAIVALGTIQDKASVDTLLKRGERLLKEFSQTDFVSDSVPAQQDLLLLLATTLGNIKDERALPFLKTYRSATLLYGRQPEIEIAIAQFGDKAFFDEPSGTKSNDGSTEKGSNGSSAKGSDGSSSNSKNDKPENWQSVSARAQGLKELKSQQAGKELLKMFAAKQDARSIPEILNGLAAAKVEDLRNILLEQLKAKDQIVRATAATLLAELNDAAPDVIAALEQSLASSALEKMNDARIAILEAADKLKHPLSLSALQGKSRDRDYIVRVNALNLLRQSAAKIPPDLQAGNLETGHDPSYWKRISSLANSDANPKAIIHMKKGNLVIELFAKDAPMTVNNFIQLAQRHYFDRLSFMRVVPNFVIQGGDPRNDMNGGPGYQIRCEINQRPYITGSVGMALSGKDTGGSQFFVTHSPQPHLDGGYTVFGQLIEGMETLRKIARGDRIEQVEIRQPNQN